MINGSQQSVEIVLCVDSEVEILTLELESPRHLCQCWNAAFIAKNWYIWEEKNPANDKSLYMRIANYCNAGKDLDNLDNTQAVHGQ
jgi:hypothetical protein